MRSRSAPSACVAIVKREIELVMRKSRNTKIAMIAARHARSIMAIDKAVV